MSCKDRGAGAAGVSCRQCTQCGRPPAALPTRPAVNKAKKRVEEIKELIEAKRTGRSKGSSEQQSIKNQLAELRLKFQALVVRAPRRAGPLAQAICWQLLRGPLQPQAAV